MATGPLPPNPAELLAGQNMARLLSSASENFDVVIIDAPPVLGLADAPLLASIAAGTLLVLGAGETRRGVVKAALKRLHFARAQMVGVVLNKFDMHARSYAYHTYGYGALEYYGSGAKSPAQGNCQFKVPQPCRDHEGLILLLIWRECRHSRIR